jgi:hypothetical protein
MNLSMIGKARLLVIIHDITYAVKVLRLSLSVLLFAISLAFVTLGKILLKYYTGESSYSVT